MRPLRILRVNCAISPEEADALMEALDRAERYGGTIILPYYVEQIEPTVVSLRPRRPKRWPSAVAHRAQRTIRCLSTGWHQARAALRTWY